MTQVPETEIRKAVKERYARLATREGSSCCSPSRTEDLGVPTEATSISDGSGEPLELINPKEGDIVLDLGSGGGVDVFHASRLAGTTGKVIAVDATPEMIWRAGDTAQKHGYTNGEVRRGEREHLPVESNTTDHVISNCSPTLPPDERNA